MNTATRLIFLATLVLSVFAIGACTSNSRIAQVRNDAPPAGEQPDDAVLNDVTHTGVAMAEDPDFSEPLTTRVFVPWDSKASLEFSTGAEHKSVGAGALIVRYGNSRSIDHGHASTIYLLEPAGAKIEPIAIQWQPESGFEFRAIARVDGALRRYDFDR